eukprot:1184200-Prorocentrum_minimum.AAC.5
MFWSFWSCFGRVLVIFCAGARGAHLDEGGADDVHAAAGDGDGVLPRGPAGEPHLEGAVAHLHQLRRHLARPAHLHLELGRRRVGVRTIHGDNRVHELVLAQHAEPAGGPRHPAEVLAPLLHLAERGRHRPGHALARLHQRARAGVVAAHLQRVRPRLT